MIQKLIQQIGLQKINAKINEFDAEINRLKKLFDNRPTKQNIGSYIENAMRDIRNAIQTAKNNLEAAIKLINFYISLYPTKDEADNIYDRIEDLGNILLKDQNITLDKNLNVGESIELNNTSGPVITFPDGSLEIRPGFLKINNFGRSVFEIRDGIAYNNGKKIITGLSKLSPGNWIELENSRNKGLEIPIYYGDAINDGAKQLLIVVKYTSRIENDHMFIDHIPVELTLGISEYNSDFFKITLNYNHIKITWARWYATIYRVYYR